MTFAPADDGMATSPLPTPKVPPILTGRAAWYPYYAGYSEDFVREVLIRSALPPAARVLDPWNGAGTTTQIAVERGLTAIGIDLNPVMVVVARARLVGDAHVTAVRQAADAFAPHAVDELPLDPEDSLCLWFDSKTSLDIRRIEQRIRCISAADPWTGTELRPETLTACFFWTALFRTVRRTMTPLRGTNPTWVRRPTQETRLSVQDGQITRIFIEEVDAMLSTIEPSIRTPDQSGKCLIGTGTSTSLPLDDASVNLIVTSPPYCTRIDYAVATSIELAVLGIGSDQAVRGVRDKMIGTTTIRPSQPAIKLEWGKTCVRLLESIENHESHASATYYLKTHQQYFDDMHTSLSELDRCLMPGGKAVIVVQDSYYKNIHNDLPSILTEMAGNMGWVLAERINYPVLRSMAGINARSRKYIDDRTSVESVLAFEKG